MLTSYPVFRENVNVNHTYFFPKLDKIVFKQDIDDSCSYRAHIAVNSHLLNCDRRTDRGMVLFCNR